MVPRERSGAKCRHFVKSGGSDTHLGARVVGVVADICQTVSKKKKKRALTVLCFAVWKKKDKYAVRFSILLLQNRQHCNEAIPAPKPLVMNVYIMEVIFIGSFRISFHDKGFSVRSGPPRGVRRRPLGDLVCVFFCF